MSSQFQLSYSRAKYLGDKSCVTEIDFSLLLFLQEDGEPDLEPHEQHRAEDGAAAREDDVTRHGQPTALDHQGPQGDLR